MSEANVGQIEGRQGEQELVTGSSANRGPANLVLDEQLWLPIDRSLLFASVGSQAAASELIYGPELLGNNPAHLAQLSNIVRHQIERIHSLEQALDETLDSVEAMRLRVLEHEVLEQQLAATEEIANLQQQAMGQLRRQLADQQLLLQAQQQEIQAREQILQELIGVVESLIQSQREDLTQYRLDRHLSPPFGRRAEDGLEPPVIAQMLHRIEVWLEQAQTQVTVLTQQAIARQAVFSDLRANLQQTRSAANQPPLPSFSPEKIQLKGQQQVQQQLQLQIQQVQEQAQQQQQQAQTMLHHARQELESERTVQAQRIEALEQQAAEMQEQILHQAQQEREYETAIQYWRDRYTSHCQHIQALSEQIYSSVDPVPAALSQLLSEIQAAIATPELTRELTSSKPEDLVGASIPATPTHQTAQPTGMNAAKTAASADQDGGSARVSLPDFLLRRRPPTNSEE